MLALIYVMVAAWVSSAQTCEFTTSWDLKALTLNQRITQLLRPWELFCVHWTPRTGKTPAALQEDAELLQHRGAQLGAGSCWRRLGSAAGFIQTNSSGGFGHCVCECVQGALVEGHILMRGTGVNQILWDSCPDPKLGASLTSFRPAA